jgi:hypothetical protein
MNTAKVQRLLRFLRLKQAGLHSDSPACCDTPLQSRQESDHWQPSSASAKHLKNPCTRNKSSVNPPKQFNNNTEQKYYLCEYQYESEIWCIEIPAESWEDAKARLQRMAYGRVIGEIKATLPSQLGLVARFWVWLKSW